MFIYLLLHIELPRFKIGKANDIYQRIPGIGGIESFNLADSFCVKLSSEQDAYRLENILLRLFKPWNLPVDEKNRFPGDTEHFEVECFDRVLKFLTDNADLSAGSVPEPLPPPPLRAPTPKNILSKEERQQLRQEREAQDRLNADLNFKAGLQDFKRGILQLMDLKLDVLEMRLDHDARFPQNRFILIETNDPDKLKCAKEIIHEMWRHFLLYEQGLHASFIISATGCWINDPSTGRIEADIFDPASRDIPLTDSIKEYLDVVALIPLATSKIKRIALLPGIDHD